MHLNKAPADQQMLSGYHLHSAVDYLLLVANKKMNLRSVMAHSPGGGEGITHLRRPNITDHSRQVSVNSNRPYLNIQGTQTNRPRAVNASYSCERV